MYKTVKGHKAFVDKAEFPSNETKTTCNKCNAVACEGVRRSLGCSRQFWRFGRKQNRELLSFHSSVVKTDRWVFEDCLKQVLTQSTRLSISYLKERLSYFQLNTHGE